MPDEIHWKRRGLIMVQDHPPPGPPSPARVAVAQLIACPTCHTSVGERCRTKSGSPARYPHSNRLVQRRCACGDPLPWHRKFWCDPCYLVALRKAKREYSARRRAKRKAVA